MNNSEAPSLDRIDLKLFLEDPEAVDWEACIETFTQWMKDDPDEWLDIADYTHMPEGPGVLVVGPEKHVSIDERKGKAGVLYSRREPFSGSNVERLRKLTSETLRFVQRLHDAEIGVRARTDAFEYIVNDRLGFPNDQETADALQSDLEQALEAVEGLSFQRDESPSERLNLTALTAQPVSIDEWTGGDGA